MSIGSKVLYENKEYIILWIYKNEYCDIRGTGNNNNKVELVRLSDLTEIK